MNLHNNYQSFTFRFSGGRKKKQKKYEHTEVYTLVTKGYNRLSLLNKTKLFIKTKQKNISDIICQITVGHRIRRIFLKTTYTILNGVKKACFKCVCIMTVWKMSAY